ncbi:hypothetical protein AU194_20385 [Mycobacterium sp. GA-2829]|nr:hypothetical protein AU194_20385 [Mycobacterium sp. GA-2829]
MAAAIAAISLAAVTTTPEVRTIALQSHLCAMIVLEALLVAVPLLALAALPPRATPKSSAKQTFWSVVVVIAVGLNSALLMTLHLPAVHDRGASLTALPASVIPLTAAVGTAYWAAILLTVGRAPHSLRRGALIVGQEVAAVLGLAALIWPPTTMGGSGVLGLSSTLDQRLGGLVMLITCAAVALPMLKRLDAQTPSQQLRTEHDVH